MWEDAREGNNSRCTFTAIYRGYKDGGYTDTRIIIVGNGVKKILGLGLTNSVILNFTMPMKSMKQYQDVHTAW